MSNNRKPNSAEPTLASNGRLIRHLFVPGSIFIASVAAFGQSPEGAKSNSAASRQVYDANCASCHGANLAGGFGPPLKGDAFRQKWNSQGRANLEAYIRQTMPPTNPGGLPSSDYAQVAQFVAAENRLDGGSSTSSPTSNPTADKPTAVASVQVNSEAGGLVSASENRDDRYRRAIQERNNLLAHVKAVSEQMLRHPPAEDWLNWRRTDDGAAYSSLTSINRANASSLTLTWSRSLAPGTNGITPLVHDGVMFINSSGSVSAFDAKTGDLLWQYNRPAEGATVGLPISQPRSLAIYSDRLIVPTNDNHMIALDVRTGKLIWDQVIKGKKGSLRISAGPIVVRGKIIQGMSGCGGVQQPEGCFVVALDALTGQEVWRFNTVARPGEPNGDTWNNAPLSERFGGSIWSSGTYDQENNLVYIGAGQTYHISPLMRENPTPRRKNAGLYTDTTLALDPDTGKLKWHYQHLPRDVWDFDWSFERIVATIPIDGRPRKVVMSMGKLGILDVLDAKTGKFIFAFDLGLQSIVTKIDPKTGWKTTNPLLDPSRTKPVFACPFPTGVRNWPGLAYNSSEHLLYVPFSDSCGDFNWLRDEGWDITYSIKPRPNSDGNYGGVAAINLVTRKIEWQRRQRIPEASAALATAGGVLFEADSDGYFRASDSASGDILWKVRLDSLPSSSPITFSVDGEQYVSISTGAQNPKDAVLQSLTPEVSKAGKGTTLWVFKLGTSSTQ